MKCKTFDAYIKEIIFHPERSKKWLADKRLTSQEKKILQGYMLIRDNQSSQVVAELLDSPISDIDFVNFHRELLLGISFNNTGNFIKAEKYLMSAIASFEKNGLNYHLFTAYVNLVNLYSNIGKIKEMGEVVHKMEALRPEGRLAQTRLLRCQFIYACDSNDNQAARILITKIAKINSEMSESDQINHLLCVFMFFVKNEELENAKQTLEQMKKHRKFLVSENFIFMKKLLSHLMEDATIYAYEREFSTLPNLFHQLKVIEHLQGEEIDEAQKHWSKLSQIDPLQHQNNFKYTGEKCLFSLCLSKHEKREKKIHLKVHSGDAPQTQVVFEILQNLQAPIKKGQLYELIWGESPEDKEDLVRLSNLISKVRATYQVTIVSRKGTYLLVSPDKQSQKLIS